NQRGIVRCDLAIGIHVHRRLRRYIAHRHLQRTPRIRGRQGAISITVSWNDSSLTDDRYFSIDQINLRHRTIGVVDRAHRQGEWGAIAWFTDGFESRISHRPISTDSTGPRKSNLNRRGAAYVGIEDRSIQ